MGIRLKNIKIPYERLKLIEYEATGNKTPVVDLGVIPGIANFDPTLVRQLLERDINFRTWLKINGANHFADSVMLYYQTGSSEYDFVTFVGEPNSSLTSNFSEMCGNGIRSLGLHIILNANKN